MHFCPAAQLYCGKTMWAGPRPSQPEKRVQIPVCPPRAEGAWTLSSLNLRFSS